MTVNITTHPEFVRQMKRYAKKYRSLTEDYAEFLKSLRTNPFQGDDLGKGLRKVRLAVASKGKGKSGGMRVITFSVEKIFDEEVNVTLLYIYDKKEMENVSDEFIRYLLER
ncbi:MAG: type II toxin-antitoxin system RelE/ParE family toxin [Bacteroidales bacterium]|nr:type II toxin-antitoxin system RelE/ParE family toxin [Bacteroidales bacterium]